MMAACMAQVRVRTEAGEYTCTRAANSYKAKFGHLQEQAAVLHEVSYSTAANRTISAAYG